MARRTRGLAALLLVSLSISYSYAEQVQRDSAADHPDPMMQRLTRKLQDANGMTAPVPGTLVRTAAADIAPPSFEGMRSGVQNFFGRVGEWFAEVGQLRPRLPQLPQRAQRGAPSGDNSSERDSSSGRDRDRDRDSSRSDRDESSSRRDSIREGRDRESRRDRDRSRRDSRREDAEILYFQPEHIMESGRLSRRDDRSSRGESRRSRRD